MSHGSKTPRHRKKKKANAPLTWAERSLYARAKRVFWIAGLLLLLPLCFVCYTYLIAPFTVRWKALYGELEYPKGYGIHGIDVSHHQGKIDWQSVATAKVEGEPLQFVIIKATQGQSIYDKNFAYNFYQASQYGLIRGAYHYFSPNVSGRVQANYFMQKVQLEEGDLPPVLDIEEIGELSVEQLRQELKVWLNLLEQKYKVPPIIYTGLKFKQQYLNTEEFARYPFWIAHYYATQVGYRGHWKFWQHTDIGKVDGIKGNVDLNVYNGSMYDLRKLTIRH